MSLDNGLSSPLITLDTTSCHVLEHDIIAQMHPGGQEI